MKIMGCDPSSTKIGLAVLNEQGRLLDAMLIKPNKASDPFHIRVDAMLRDFGKAWRAWYPDYVALEMPSDHAAGRIKGRSQGLAIYGFAVGAVWELLGDHITRDKTKLYDAQEWTNRKKKEDRAIELAMRRPEYKAIMDARPRKDPGYDVADAIQLAEICLKDIQIEARLVL